MHPVARLEQGTIFARDFRVLGPLAEGGMGEIYLVEQLSTMRQRALKLMHPQLIRNARSRERFALEAQASSKIESDHVVEVVGAGVDETTGIPWMAMELLRGQTLADVITERGTLSPGEVRDIAHQISHALGQAHDLGLVHRDLKPENLFLAVPRRADVKITLKILDFGIAKWTQEAQDDVRNSQIIGSPFWMAPEQLEHGGMLFPSTDVWALGLIAFFLLTGRIYWKAANVEVPAVSAAIVEVMVGPIDRASDRAQELGVAELIPPGFDDWFGLCLDRDPIARFPTASECLNELARILDESITPKGITEELALTAARTPINIAHFDTQLPMEDHTIPSVFAAAPDIPVRQSRPSIPELKKFSSTAGSMDFLEEQLAAASDPKQKAEVAVRVARVFEIAESERARAIAAYSRALEYDSGSMDALRGLSVLYRLARKWSELVEVLTTLARLDDGRVSASDRLALGEEATDVLDQQLNHPGEAAATLEHVIPLARALADNNRVATLFLRQGKLLARVEGREPAAIHALEEALKLRPGDPVVLEALAELRLRRRRGGTPSLIPSAVAVSLDPSSLERQARSHLDAGLFDRGFCVAGALYALHSDRCPPDLRQLYEQHKKATLTPRGRLDAEAVWNELLPAPGLDPQVSAVLRLLLPTLRKHRALPPEALGYQEREVLDPATSAPSTLRAAMPLYRALLPATATLDLSVVPRYYVRQRENLGLSHLQSDPTSSLLGNIFLQPREPAELAFAAARHLAYLRPELNARVWVSDGKELASVLRTVRHALGMPAVTSNFDPGFLQTLSQELQLHPTLRGELRKAYEAMELRNIDDACHGWLRASELTATRVGLVLSGDLGAALRAVALEPRIGASGAPSEDEQKRALGEYAVSEAYFRIRELLGIMVRRKKTA